MQASRFFRSLGWPPTPCVSVPALAAAAGIGQLSIKDESARQGLNAFKIVGVAFALAQLRARGLVQDDATLVAASTGNHGRAVAHAARQAGLRARIYVGTGTAAARIAAIERAGAAVVRVSGTYDDAVRQARSDAERFASVVVSDTSWPGYEQIPRWIMQGYTWIAEETATQWDQPPDVVMLQAGVGSFAAGVASWFRGSPTGEAIYGGASPKLVCCEPTGAACVLESARAGERVVLSHTATIMAGLGCAEASLAAWPALRDCFDAYLAINDDWVTRAMRRLAGDDLPVRIVAGESGACGVAAVMALHEDPVLGPLRDHLGLTPHTRILAFNTEGATDPEGWRRTAGE